MLIHTEIFNGSEFEFHFNNGVFTIAKKNEYCETYQHFRGSSLIECIAVTLKSFNEADKLLNQIKKTSLKIDNWTNNHKSAKMLLSL